MLHFQHYPHIAGEVVIFIETCGKWPISGGKEGPFMQSQFHQADRNSSIPLFMQLCPPIKLHQPFCSFLPLILSPPSHTLTISSDCARSLRWVSHSPGTSGEVKRHEGARNPEFHLPTAVIGAKPQCFHGSKEGPVMWGVRRGKQGRHIPREVLTVML